MKNVLRQWFIIALAFSLVGCASSTIPSLYEDEELTALMTALYKNSAKKKRERKERQSTSIRQLEVKKTTDGYTVSADLEQASIPVVVRRMFDEFDNSYVIEDVSLHGAITARFTNLAFIDALDRIVGAIGLSAESEDGVVVIKSGLKEDAQAESGLMYREITLRNLDMKTVHTMLDALYPQLPGKGRVVYFGHIPASNSLYLYGPSWEVSSTLQLLRKADRDIPHVVIEVLVVEFNSDALEEIGTELIQVADGNSNSIQALFFGAFDVDFQSFDDISDFDIKSLRALIELFASDGRARLISRPYVATLSGSEAEIEITSERYVIVEEETGSTSKEPVESGVVLKITPTVLPDEELRMEVYVRDSQFSIVSVANVLTEVKANTAQTIMQVEDGQTIMIGGLMLNRYTWSNSGFPILKDIPILNLIAGDRTSLEEVKEVSIFITPHIWRPQMRSPIIEPEALTGEGS